jgi:hypothetical protein
MKLHDIAKNATRLNNKEQKKELETVINAPHIKKIIDDKSLLDRTGPGKTHGKLIYAAYISNTNNLIDGPGRHKNGKHLRGSDPGAELDSEIIDKQPKLIRQSIMTLNEDKDPTVSKFMNGLREEPVPTNFYEYKGENKTENGQQLIKDKFYVTDYN